MHYWHPANGKEPKNVINDNFCSHYRINKCTITETNIRYASLIILVVINVNPQFFFFFITEVDFIRKSKLELI